eukprot:2300809-Alexandrium_andersonii.AAC.1
MSISAEGWRALRCPDQISLAYTVCYTHVRASCMVNSARGQLSLAHRACCAQSRLSYSLRCHATVRYP